MGSVKVCSVARLPDIQDKNLDGLISIRTSKSGYSPEVDKDIIRLVGHKFMVVWFDDAIPLSQHLISPIQVNNIFFSENHAKSILEFVKDKENLLIHCDAGFSRSVAVGAFLRDFFNAEVEFMELGHDKFRNIHVYNILRRVFWGAQDGIISD